MKQKSIREDGKPSHTYTLQEGYCEMATLPKAIQCQHNPHQTSNAILHRNLKINLQFYMETQKTQVKQNSPEQ